MVTEKLKAGDHNLSNKVIPLRTFSYGLFNHQLLNLKWDES